MLENLKPTVPTRQTLRMRPLICLWLTWARVIIPTSRMEVHLNNNRPCLRVTSVCKSIDSIVEWVDCVRIGGANRLAQLVLTVKSQANRFVSFARYPSPFFSSLHYYMWRNLIWLWASSTNRKCCYVKCTSYLRCDWTVNSQISSSNRRLLAIVFTHPLKGNHTYASYLGLFHSH